MGLPENRNAFFNKINKLKFKGADKNRLKLLHQFLKTIRALLVSVYYDQYILLNRTPVCLIFPLHNGL